MESVKSVFGIALLVAALYYLKNVVPALAHFTGASRGFLGVRGRVVVPASPSAPSTSASTTRALDRARKGLGVALMTVGLFAITNFVLTPKVELAWLHAEPEAVAEARDPAAPCSWTSAPTGASPARRWSSRCSRVRMSSTRSNGVHAAAGGPDRARTTIRPWRPSRPSTASRRCRRSASCLRRAGSFSDSTRSSTRRPSSRAWPWAPPAKVRWRIDARAARQGRHHRLGAGRLHGGHLHGPGQSGAGPIRRRRLCVEPVTVPGGQLVITSEVENYPGFPSRRSGAGADAAIQSAGRALRDEHSHLRRVAVDLSSRPFRVSSSDGEVMADAVIVATGASAKWMGLPSEQKFQNCGVSACGTCDGALFKGRELIVVGGGDTAMEEAVFLTRFATKVVVVHRRDVFRASRIMLERARRNPKIEFVTNACIDEVLGEVPRPGVTGVHLKDTRDGSVRVDSDGWCLHRHRTPSRTPSCSRASWTWTPQDPPHQSRLDRHQGPGRVRVRRRGRSRLSTGDHAAGHGMHGCDRRRALPLASEVRRPPISPPSPEDRRLLLSGRGRDRG